MRKQTRRMRLLKVQMSKKENLPIKILEETMAAVLRQVRSDVRLFLEHPLGFAFIVFNLFLDLKYLLKHV